MLSIPKRFRLAFVLGCKLFTKAFQAFPPIAIDVGKTLRGSGVDGKKALHLVSAWATANELSLGQVTVEEKSNEIPAIPGEILLELLDIHGVHW